MSFQGVSSDHEVLTESGWKLLSLVQSTEKIATLCLEHNKLEYLVPSEWKVTTLVSSDNVMPVLLRQNRVEVRLAPSTKIVSKLSKESLWEPLLVSDLNGIDFYVRNYIGDCVLKPINYQPATVAFSGKIYLPINTNNTFLVRKNSKMCWVCTN